MGCFTHLFSWNRSKIVFRKILSLTVGALKITFVERWKGLSLRWYPPQTAPVSEGDGIFIPSSSDHTDLPLISNDICTQILVKEQHLTLYCPMFKISFLRKFYGGGQKLSNPFISLEILNEIKPTVETFVPGLHCFGHTSISVTALSFGLYYETYSCQG